MKRYGFSLIELLVVLAIIAILAALLFSVFGAVKARARSTTCLSQLHQVGLAAGMYQADNEGQLPPDQIIQTNPPARLAWDLLLPYTKSKAVFICPDALETDDKYVGYIYCAGVVKLTDKTRKFYGVDGNAVVAYCLDHTAKHPVGFNMATDFDLDSTGHHKGMVNAVRLDASAISVDGSRLEEWVYAIDGQWYPLRSVPKGLNYSNRTFRFPNEPWPPAFQL